MAKDVLKKYSKYYWIIAIIGIVLLIMYGGRLSPGNNSMIGIINLCAASGGHMVTVSATSFDCICPTGNIFSMNGCVADPSYVAPSFMGTQIENISNASTLELVFYYILPVLIAIGLLIFAFILYRKRN